MVLRRADTTEVIGTNLAAKVRNDGYRTIVVRLSEEGVQHAYRADPDILNRDVGAPGHDVSDLSG